MLIYVLIVTLAIIVTLIMYKKTEDFCSCIGTTKVGKPAYYNYSTDDVSKYGARDGRWPVGTPYDAYSMDYKRVINENAEQYALDNCRVKPAETPSAVYETAKRAPSPTAYVTTPEGCTVPLMVNGLPRITESPAGSFSSPSAAAPGTCANFSPYNMAIGVL
jgi:hypothetical protein